MSKIIYVIGSGSSLNYINPKFFESVTTIGVNNAYKFFDCDYNVVHHENCLIEMVESGARNIHASLYDTGIKSKGTNPVFKEVTYFEHEEQPYLKPNFDIQNREGWLVEGGTTTIPAMSLAAKMSDIIILCGVDGYSLHGNNNVKGYYKDDKKERKHSTDTNLVVRNFKKYLETKHNKMVYSLNPFVNIKYIQ